ncbi:MAG: hypothetical protein WDN67_01280 [Candidatus Moraniibacteriota bacterium]
MAARIPDRMAKIGKQPVYEAPYVYDVALRLAQAIQTQGGGSASHARDAGHRSPDRG